jgi:ditrans,polycis-polyprenyl diphosphate synthase
MAYTSRDEMVTAVRNCVRNALAEGPYVEPYVACTLALSVPLTPRHRHITEDDIEAELMTTKGGSPPLDILVRTSGVKRLSDFLLWQVYLFMAVCNKMLTRCFVQCCDNTQLQFSSAYWPDFGLFEFVPIILDYQLKVWGQRIRA